MLKDTTPKTKITHLVRTGIPVTGLVISIILPIAATLVTAQVNHGEISSNSILQAQLSDPVLWVVDLVALFFLILNIILAYYELRQSNQVHKLKEELSQRTAELYNLKEMSQRQILEQNQAEETISRAKHEWEATFDAISDLILLTDSTGKIIRCNRVTIEKLATTYNDLLGKNIEEVFPGVVEPVQKSVLNTTQVIPMPSLYGWFEITGFPFQVYENQQGVIYIFHDIAQRRRAEAEIQRQKQFFEGIFENSPVAIVTMDMNGSIVTCNPAFERLFGYTQVEVIGNKLDDMITDAEYREKALDLTRRVRRGEIVRRRAGHPGAIPQHHRAGARPQTRRSRRPGQK
jgi:PAS domain-containing protein